MGDELDDAASPPDWWDVAIPGQRWTALPLSELIARLGEGVERFDEGFAREVARALHGRAAHVRVPAVDRLGIEDVVATLSMDREMRLVVTGHLPDVRAQVTLRWDEADFPALPVELFADPVERPYTFATLDFSVRGKKATLTAPAPPLPAGQTVTVRALATIGATTEYRVVGLGLELSVPPDAIELI